MTTAETETDQLPRYNHYVPEFVLNYFSVNGHICVFDKHTLKKFKLPTNRAMGERDYNNVYLDDVIVSFENRFTHLENLTAPVIAEIVRHKTLDHLGQMELATIHTFMVLQILRSKSRRLDQTKISNEVRRRWPDIELNPHPERINDGELEKLFMLKFTFDKLEELTKPLILKHMFLMLRDCKDNVYISDNPLVMHNQRTFGPYGNVGLAVPGIEIYYPLTPDIVLAYFCPSTLEQMEHKHAESDQRVSSFFASKMRSGDGISAADTVLLAQMRAEIKRSKDYYRLLKDNRAVPMDSHNVLYLNSLQLMSSHRFIAAAKSEFSFARRALNERPDWKEGRRVQVA